jgi:N6-L-threonylcarbamoyladenine synthase
MLPAPILLGIESSCDDTAAAVVAGGELISSVISSQEDHAAFGGVVPELASRAHLRAVIPIVEAALDRAGIAASDLDAVAVTRGPGLAGSLLVGLSFAKALALSLDVPLVGVNHLEGHVYSLFLENDTPPFPFLCLIVSGGHTQLVRVDEGFRHDVLGKTRDDAAGEAFDKVAKLLGLGYPGGPVVESAAAGGDPEFVSFPRTRLPGYDYSFSGIKTSVLYHLNAMSETERRRHLDGHLEDLCASFQQAVVDMLVEPVSRAVQQTGLRCIGLVGGVSANRALRQRLESAANAFGGRLFVPAPIHSTDNAAMIAITAHYKLGAGDVSPLSLTADPALALT